MSAAILHVIRAPASDKRRQWTLASVTITRDENDRAVVTIKPRVRVKAGRRVI